MSKSTGRRRAAKSSAKQRDGVTSFSSPRAGKRAAVSTKPKRSRPEEIFEAWLRSHGYRDFVTEHKFMLPRRFRFDFAWPEKRVAIEIEGGIFMRGRHVRPSGFINDAEKYNAATMNGWRVYRVPVCKEWLMSAMAFVIHEKLS